MNHSYRPAGGRRIFFTILCRKLSTVILCIVLSSLVITGCSKKSSNKEKTGTVSESGQEQKKASGSTGKKENQSTGDNTASDMDLEAVFFDVGKGDCILFTSGDSHVLIDAGYEETSDDIIKKLKEKNVDSLDAMIITHYDKDHVGGAAEIASAIPVSMFYLPDYNGDIDKCGDLVTLIDSESMPCERVSSAREFTTGSSDFKINPALVAYNPKEKNDNDASLIVEVSCGEDQWLLPGDIEKDAIDLWLRDREQEYNVLKYPHHGKKEKNYSEFIDNVSPEIAVITDSDEDHASKKVLKKLDEDQVETYRSSVDGTITIKGNGTGQFDISTEK